MKYFFLLAFLFSSSFLFGQSKSFSFFKEIKDDEVRLKWFPTDFSQMNALIQNGAEVSRIESSSSDYASLNFESGTKTTIQPAKENLKTLSNTDVDYDKITSLVDPFINTINTVQEAKEFAFAMITLENSVSNKLGKIIGCELTDKTIKIGTNYVYRIRIKGLSDQFVTVETGTKTVYPAISIQELKLDQKNAAELRFDTRTYLSFGFGFHIERSEGNTSNPKQLTEIPYVKGVSSDVIKGAPDFYRDQTYEEGKTYFYRIVGLNYFGERSMFSDWVKLEIPTFIHGAMYIDTVYADGTKRVISGSFQTLDKTPISIKKYVLFRSEQNMGSYKAVQEQTFKDTLVTFSVTEEKTGDHCYYKIAAIRPGEDTIFSTSRYVFTLDQEPPLPPTNIKATIDSLGVVKITWNASPDTDVQGYRIFRANEKTEEFTERTTNLQVELNYTDTVLLNNLTPEIYYFVWAQDLNFNNSISSDTILVLKPDTIAPVACLITVLKLNEKSIDLSWQNSESIDVKEHYLVRQTANGTDTLLNWQGSLQSTFTDSSLLAGKDHIYSIVTYDKAGNKSVSQYRKQLFEPGYRNAVTGFKATKNSKLKTIDLSWTQPNEVVFNYFIYRKDNDGKFTLYKTLAKDATSFSDKQLSIGNIYTYYVQYITDKGIRSMPSENLKVVY